MARGLLVALEGLDGSGKSTHVEPLAAHVRTRRPCVTTAEPSARPLGRLLRAQLGGPDGYADDVQALLFAADRLDHLRHEIEPHLEAGAVVVCDRYLLSSCSYQGAVLPLEFVRQINGRARRPDATLFLRVGCATAEARLRRRGGAAQRVEQGPRLAAVARLYDQTLALAEAGRVFEIDAEAPVEAVAAQLRQALDALLSGAP